MTLSFSLTGDAERRLAEVAKRPNVPLNDLAAAAIRDLLAQPAEDFDRVAGASSRKTANCIAASPECAISRSAKSSNSTDASWNQLVARHAFGIWGRSSHLSLSPE